MRNINLLPDHYRPQPKFDFKNFVMILAISLIVLIFLGGITFLQLSIRNTNKLASTIENNVELLENTLEGLQQEIEELTSIQEIIKTVEMVEGTKSSHIEIIDQINDFTPQGMVITSLNISDSGVNIQGEANALNTISSFVDSLYLWDYSNSVQLSQINSSSGNYLFSVQVSQWRSE